ncbi:hypothetical protein ACJX0J_008729, partial [Zea mays]
YGISVRFACPNMHEKNCNLLVGGGDPITSLLSSIQDMLKQKMIFYCLNLVLSFLPWNVNKTAHTLYS